MLGASPKPERYSNRAIRLLLEHNHSVIPVHPAMDAIEGLPVCRTLSDITESVHTLTMYVSAVLSTPLAAEVLALRPERVIFNPGTENPELYGRLDEAGIPHEEACTLVLLNSGQF